MTHLDDKSAYGIIIERRKANVQEYSVLWSKHPQLVKIYTQQINSTSRKLKTKWSTQTDEDLKIFGEAIEYGLHEGLKNEGLNRK